MRQSNICPPKKSGFPIICGKNSAGKNFSSNEKKGPVKRTKKKGPVKSELVNAAKHEGDGTSESDCRKRASKVRNAVGNGECRICFGKIPNFQFFLMRTGKKIYSKKHLITRRK